MKRPIVIAVAVGFAVGGLVALFALLGWPMLERERALDTPKLPVWAEVQWPFPMDEWGKGKAFRCEAPDCGVQVNVYIRAKIGFCNCTTGVSDDDELVRLADFKLIGESPLALGAGRPISVAWMKGRSRAYTDKRHHHSALAVAFNDRCDAVVATALIAHSQPGPIEPSVIAFLNSNTVIHWAEVTLGL
jgi:hypothetical protein